LKKPHWEVETHVAKNEKSQRGGILEEFHHVGLLCNEPPGTAGLPFI
jgi:hypothetical protein